MLEYDRIYMSEGIDVTKTANLRKCYICQYWYVLEINYKFQPKVCNGCHNIMQKALNFNDVVIVFVKKDNYRIHFWHISKYKAVNLLRNADLTEKIGKI